MSAALPSVSRPLFAASAADEEAVSATINTTPLVDVMLVLLIIFLITIPVVTHSVAVSLPKERNVAREVAPEHIQLSVDARGQVFWNAQLVGGPAALLKRLKGVAGSDAKVQPEVHIHGDENARYEAVGRLVLACQQAGLVKLHFVIEPPARGGR